MFTLKIKWERFENGEVVDETTIFVPADYVKIHGQIKSLDDMKAWAEGQFQNYAIKPTETGNEIMSSRLIEVYHNDGYTWFLASRAWLMGPDGSTIERVVP